MGKSTYLIKYAMLGGILYSAIITVYPNGLHAETKPRGIRLLSDINTISFTVENEGSPQNKLHDNSAQHSTHSPTNNNNVSFSVMDDGISQTPSAVNVKSKNNLTAPPPAHGLYWDDEKGIHTNSIWGNVTNLDKDLSGTTKELIADNIASYDLTSMASNPISAGIPVEYIDLGPTGIATLVYESQLPTAMEAQYAALTDYSAALGPAGNMDYRNGICFIDGYDYTGIINAYIYGPGLKHEGYFPWLYLDSECLLTIGIGSVMKEYSSRHNLEGYKAYFNTMEYVECKDLGNFEVDCTNALPVPQKQKDADLEKMYNLEGQCLAGEVGKNYKATYYRGSTHPRRITNQSAQEVFFQELCKHHMPKLIQEFKKEAALQKSPRNFLALSPGNQHLVLDISYQAGVGRWGKKGSMSPLRRALVNGSCSSMETAIAAFKKIRNVYINKDGERIYIERNNWRVGQMRKGCMASKKKTSTQNEKGLKNKKTGAITKTKKN